MGCDGNKFVSLSASQSDSAKNLPGLFTMLLKGVAEEGGEVVASLSLVLVVLLGFVRRCALCGALCFGAVRCARAVLLAEPNW